ADFRRGPIRVAIQRYPFRAANCQESEVRFEICAAIAVPLSRSRDRGMLAWQHDGETGKAELLQTPRPIGSARPVASPEYLRGRSFMKKKILVVDVGGTSVKLLMSRRDERAFPSG